MIADPSPEYSEFAINCHELKGGAPVRPGKRPRQFPNAEDAAQSFDAKFGGPIWDGAITPICVCSVDLLHCCTEKRSLLWREAMIVGEESFGLIVLHVSSASR